MFSIPSSLLFLACALTLSKGINTTDTTDITDIHKIRVLGLPRQCAGTPRQVFLWAEWPNVGNEISGCSLFYDNLLSKIQGNCASLNVTRLILRVLHPSFPPNSSTKFWWPPQESPLFTHFLSKIRRPMEIFILPYIARDDIAYDSWRLFNRNSFSSALEGVFAFTQQWNTFLSSTSTRVRFAGVTVDYEEIPKSGADRELWPIGGPSQVSQFKVTYGPGLKLGVAIGFDMKGRMLPSYWGSFVDAFFLELYDFYYPLAGVDSTSASPFLLYQNNPQALWSFIKNRILVGNIPAIYNQFAPQAFMMWSLQSRVNSDCAYPLKGACGNNYEFGVWNARSFNNFLALVMAEYPNVAQGIYEFSYWPAAFSRPA